MIRRFVVCQAAMDLIEYALLLFVVVLCTTALMMVIQDSLTSVWSAAAAKQAGVQHEAQRGAGTGKK